jgi:hypothetical protein
MAFDQPLSLQDLRLGRPRLAKTERTFRVLLLGDSVAMPQGVSAEQGVAFLLEQAVSRMMPGADVEVVNPSVGGMSFHHYALLAQANVDSLKPDLIVFCLCPNDSEINYTPLTADLEEAGKLQWGEGAALVQHLRLAARQLAPAIAAVPAILLGMNYLELPGAADMDRVLRGICDEVGWKYVTTRGRLDTLPRERLIASDIDHHPSGYVHQVAVNEICLAMTRDLRLHQKSPPPDVPAMLPPVLDRLAGVPVQSMAFRAELIRIVDSLTQKNNQLRKSPRASVFSQAIEELTAARTALIAILERHADSSAIISRLRGHELNGVPQEDFPVAMFQRMKLINACVHDVVGRHLAIDAALPFVTAGDEPPPGREEDLLLQVQQLIPQLASSCKMTRDSAVRRETAVDTAGLPAPLASAIDRVADLLDAAHRDGVCRAEQRRSDVEQLLGDAAAYGQSLVDRARADLTAGGVRRRAAARALHQFIQVVQLFKGTQFQLGKLGTDGKAFWSPQPWEGAECAPRWTLEVEISSDRRNAVGLWVESITPAGFFADYQQTSPGGSRYAYTFPHCNEFFLKLAGSAPFTVGKATLSDGRQTIDASWIQRAPHYHRGKEIIRAT